jgi:16S rRNA (adenine1518-N6/adenine1519-N6)-dimethyltransferase
VLTGWRSSARILFDIPPAAFVPRPNVTSSVVRLEPRQAPLPCCRRLLERATQAAFGQRRKMLRQSLKTLAADPLRLLAAAGLEPTARAEDVPMEGYVRLARALGELAVI